MPKRTTAYSTSAEWSDITPIPLSDDMTLDTSPTAHPIQPLATIAYSPQYTEAMSYLRAIMAKNEFSERVLALTEDVIGMNPAHYTVWNYRGKCLRVLHHAEGKEGLTEGEDEWIMEELEWLNGVARRNLKNYQIWHHRQSLLTLLSSLPPGESEFLTSILSLDTKNYHVWSYRQWLCTKFPDKLLYSPDEMKRVEVMIDDDIHNNSAWNHRWFLVFGAEDLKDGGVGGLKGNGVVVDEEIVEREVGFAKGKIEIAPMNLSAWNYLKGVLRRAGRELSTEEQFCLQFVGEHGDVEQEQEEGRRGVRSSHAVEWLAEIYGRKGEVEKAGACWNALGRKWDPVRRNYWEFRRKKLEQEYGGAEGISGQLEKGGQQVEAAAI